jgi:hypothetical protein
MTNQHSLTPPPELVQQLCDSAALSRSFKNISIREVDVLLILEAFQTGADQELEACVKWLVANQWFLPEGKGLTTFRAVRRPKPPSLKEQALAELEILRGDANAHRLGFDAPAIRRALEALPND